MSLMNSEDQFDPVCVDLQIIELQEEIEWRKEQDRLCTMLERRKRLVRPLFVDVFEALGV